MDQNSNSRLDDTGAVPPPERRPILLRAYAEPKRRRASDWAPRPSDWVLFFDTETFADETQRLRIGTFQLWRRDKRKQLGVFYDPDAVLPSEMIALETEAAIQGYKLLSLNDFMEKVFFKAAHRARATVVGFNLPFDLSRLALDWPRAKRVRRRGKSDEASNLDQSMVGGFSCGLSDRKDRPRLRINHLSRRSAFINFTAADDFVDREKRKRGEHVDRERGFFLDVKTLAAALTSTLYSLDGLAEHLGVKRKIGFSDFGREIDAEFISYALNDTEVTRQCYIALIKRFDQHGLVDTIPHRIYSEASLGKAYLRQMKIKPWREVQPDFDPKIIGAIMSSYFGGRAEIHRRREIVQTLYCDFASMYPSVCTLMGLWRYVIADGMTERDATAETQQFLDRVTVADLKNPNTWKQLHVLVGVRPNEDIFPVRARYGEEPIATIGVNYLSAGKPLWFTLADCIASKLLSGKAPQVLKAIRFSAGEPQRDLRPVAINRNPDYQIDPAKDDFYKRVIDLRRSVQGRLRGAQRDGAPLDEIKHLDTEQLALKILANATSYGIFIELNVEDADKDTAGIQIHSSAGSREAHAGKREEPGDYFHPLLGTLITGGARLMLAITERLLIDEGLDWAFCDTDSMAFAAPVGMNFDEFERRVRDVCAFFEGLNPYEQKGSILEFEDHNYRRNSKELAPLYCATISAKRYALFNLDAAGEPIIRKASAHGLGHYHPPYRELDSVQERESGVHFWQEDLWKEIIKSLRSSNPAHLPLDWREEISRPAVSQYSATTPDRLAWFKDYNRDKPPSKKVRPFNFMLEFYGRRPNEMARQGLLDRADGARVKPKPVAPYNRDPYSMITQIWDRITRQPVPLEWLRTYAETLRGYHRHPETKFLNGGPMDSGPTRRRHVLVECVEDIGKEADKWDDEEPITAEDDFTVSYGVSIADRDKMIEVIRSVPLRRLAEAARVSHHSIPKHGSDGASTPGEALRKMFRAALGLKSQMEAAATDDDEIRSWLLEKVQSQGMDGVAATLRIDASNLRKILAGNRRIPKAIRQALQSGR